MARFTPVDYMGMTFKSIKDLWIYGQEEYGMTGVCYQRFRLRWHHLKNKSPERLFASENLNVNHIMFRGKETSVSEISREFGYSKQCLSNRLKEGMTIEEALRKPIVRCDRPYTVTPEGYCKYAKDKKDLVDRGLPSNWFSMSLDDICANAMKLDSKYNPHESTVEGFRGGFKIG